MVERSDGGTNAWLQQATRLPSTLSRLLTLCGPFTWKASLGSGRQERGGRRRKEGREGREGGEDKQT